MLATLDHQRLDSPTFDEPFHLFGAVEYVRDGTFWINLEHPPLLKLLAGACLGPYPIKSPGQLGPTTRSPRDRYFRFLYFNSLPADEILAIARRPFPWLLAGTVVVVYLLARRLWGVPAAFLASTLIGLDPNLIAHAGVLHTDAGAVLFMTAAVGAALLALEKRHLAWWVAAGVVLGLALAAKFTAVLLVPVFVALPLLRRWLTARASDRPGTAVPQGTLAADIGGVAIAGGAALLVLYAVYAFCLRNMPDAIAERSVVEFLASRGASGRELARMAQLSRLTPPLAHYVAGVRGVALESTNGRGANFLLGRISQKGFPEYFAVAFLIKSTPALLAVALAALVLGKRKLLELRSLALLLPAALVFLAATRTCFNIGVRHILPIYPLLAITASGILAERLSRRAFQGTVVAAVLSCGVSVLSIHPIEFAYFNAIVGSPEKGSAWLVDSNLDWGQDMKRLAGFLDSRGWEDSTTLLVYSGFANNYYSRRSKVLSHDAPIAPGRYVLGATVQALGGAYTERLEGKKAAAKVDELREALRKRGRRVAWVAGGLIVWELPEAPAEPGEPEKPTETPREPAPSQGAPSG